MISDKRAPNRFLFESAISLQSLRTKSTHQTMIPEGIKGTEMQANLFPFAQATPLKDDATSTTGTAGIEGMDIQQQTSMPHRRSVYLSKKPFGQRNRMEQPETFLSVVT